MAVNAQLFRLEALDADLERREAELRELRRKQEGSPELDAAAARLEELRAQEREAAVEQRTLESELAELEAKIKRDQNRMYGGQIVDPRELASLERELGHYAAERDALEERCLLAMERLEGLQSALEATSRQADEARARSEEDRPALARRAEQLAHTLADLRAERDALAASIDARSLDLYRRLRSSAGHAVSHVSDGVCQWCRVAIPPKDVQHARSGALVTCTNCQRILYAGR
jgi:predicted  nucleic acid-binding Zn-ribbon protein